MNNKTKCMLALSVICSLGMLSAEALAQNAPIDNAPQCINEEPEQITQDLITFYPSKWKTYVNSIQGYRLEMPSSFIIETYRNAPKVNFSSNWCGTEPGAGDASPFSWTVSFHRKKDYRPEPIQDFDSNQTSYLKPVSSEISCSKLHFHQDHYKNDNMESSYDVIDRILIERGKYLYKLEFHYGPSGVALKAGHQAAVKRFISENEQLKCYVLSSFEFISLKPDPH